MPITYLDHNATARLLPAVRDELLAALEETGNPSSVHGPGRRARQRVDRARAQIAALAGVEPARIVFTSGATEANATAVAGAELLASAIEHPSVLAWAKATAPVLADGTLDLDALDALLAGGRYGLVAVMAVNNETGVIQPVARAAEIVRRHGAALLVDAVQAAGRIPLAPLAEVADFLSLSAHKIGGPAGTGALVLASSGDRCFPYTPLLRGGAQEQRRRAGTENVAAIAGFGVAAELAAAAVTGAMPRVAGLRDRLEAALREVAPELVVHGQAAPRVANTSCFGVSGLPAETVLMALDLDGIAVSSGSACSSGKLEPSHVLTAMGLCEADARAAIRVSLGPDTGPEDIERLRQAWSKLYHRRRRHA